MTLDGFRWLVGAAVSAAMVTFVAAGCGGGSVATPDADALTIAGIGAAAAELASGEMEQPVLRQVDASPGGAYRFRFVDPQATGVVVVIVPQLSTPIDQWEVLSTPSLLVGFQAEEMDLTALRVGPDRVSRAIVAHWRDCQVRGLVIYGENGDLVWTAFCTLPDGSVVSGRMYNQDGRFEAFDNPPAFPQPTAIPE